MAPRFPEPLREVKVATMVEVLDALPTSIDGVHLRPSKTKRRMAATGHDKIRSVEAVLGIENMPRLLSEKRDSLVEKPKPRELQAPWVKADGSSPAAGYIEKEDWESLDSEVDRVASPNSTFDLFCYALVRSKFGAAERLLSRLLTIAESRHPIAESREDLLTMMGWRLGAYAWGVRISAESHERDGNSGAAR